ncbi:MAG: transglutaminase domain-containing protein [Candidatus Magnetomorum sp.]|nr:transglutaminase domain-containing protein [Candidatus Magnetomorum sp.]
MPITEKKVYSQWPYIGLIFFGAMFIALICIRLGLFEKNVDLLKDVSQTLSAQETWMNIFHQNHKIGYSQRMIQPQEDIYTLSDKTWLQLNTMGVLQEVFIKTSAILNKDMSLSQFSFQLTSDPFAFKVQGTIESNMMRLVIDNTETQIPIQEKIFLPTALMDAAYALQIEPGEKQKITLFDPSTMGMRTVLLTCTGHETLNIQGVDYPCTIYSMEFMGMTSSAWIDSNGQIIQEKGIMGMTLQKTSKETALHGLSDSKHNDLIEWVSIKSNILIDDPERLREITFQIDSSFDAKILDGGRQSLTKNIQLTINREHIPPPPFSTENMQEYIHPTVFIPSDHPRIQEQLDKIVKRTDPILVKVKKLMVWMNANIQKRPVLSVPNAIETLNHKRGDCNEHATLLASFLRASGIPTQICAGLVYLNGRFYYHAWNEIYLNQWISLDTIMEQLPADVTHIRLVRGEPDAQMALLGMIGNIQIKILEKKYD